jgi:proteasome lid subunit RPN8/RPN11
MFDGSGFSRLWKHCRETGLTVLADVHTHPGDHPQQSETDRQNPMICELGHIAVILPRFAATWGWRFRGVGLYEYQGHYRWRRWTGSERKNRVRFSLW